MSASTQSRPAAGAPCGCNAGVAGTAAATPCTCAGAGCGACQPQGYARPQFFAGQLLTEEDLQALSDYALNKQRLHNRNFLGAGVVCGLQVSCDPCGGGKLVVQPGHALDCHGNDLVLECAVELDANAMVRDLRRSQRGADCGDPCADSTALAARSDGSRQPDTRRYCLYVRYTETATDPVAPYATDQACGSSACKATRMREGVRFELRCRTGMPPADGFLPQVRACLAGTEALTAAIDKLVQEGANADDVRKARTALLDAIDASPQFGDCRLRADVAAVPLPGPDDSIAAAREKLVTAYLRLLRDCICHALLPPCPPCDDSAVLLACIDVADCQVVDVCNLERKFVLTGPNVRYWLPLDPVGDLLERLCCEEVRIGREQRGPGTDAALRMLRDQVTKTYGLRERDVETLDRIWQNLQHILRSPMFAGFLRGRVMRLFGAGAVEGTAAGGQAAGTQTVDTLANENRELRARLDEVMERLARLEGAPPPAGDAAKKTRK